MKYHSAKLSKNKVFQKISFQKIDLRKKVKASLIHAFT